MPINLHLKWTFHAVQQVHHIIIIVIHAQSPEWCRNFQPLRELKYTFCCFRLLFSMSAKYSCKQYVRQQHKQNCEQLEWSPKLILYLSIILYVNVCVVTLIHHKSTLLIPQNYYNDKNMVPVCLAIVVQNQSKTLPSIHQATYKI